jgi:hypothetical protein
MVHTCCVCVSCCSIPPSSVAQYHHVGHPVRLRDEKGPQGKPVTKIMRGLTSLELEIEGMEVRVDCWLAVQMCCSG